METDGALFTIRSAIHALRKYRIQIDSLTINYETVSQMLNEKDSIHLIEMGWWSGHNSPKHTVCGVPFKQAP